MIDSLATKPLPSIPHRKPSLTLTLPSPRQFSTFSHPTNASPSPRQLSSSIFPSSPNPAPTPPPALPLPPLPPGPSPVTLSLLRNSGDRRSSGLSTLSPASPPLPITPPNAQIDLFDPPIRSSSLPKGKEKEVVDISYSRSSSPDVHQIIASTPRHSTPRSTHTAGQSSSSSNLGLSFSSNSRSSTISLSNTSPPPSLCGSSDDPSTNTDEEEVLINPRQSGLGLGVGLLRLSLDVDVATNTMRHPPSRTSFYSNPDAYPPLDGSITESDSDTDSELDLHTPLPDLLLRAGILSPSSTVLKPKASTTGLATPTPTPRAKRHRSPYLLREGIGLTTGLGWSDSEDEGVPGPLRRRVSALVEKKLQAAKESKRLTARSLASPSPSTSRIRATSTYLSPRPSLSLSTLSRARSPSTSLNRDSLAVPLSPTADTQSIPTPTAKSIKFGSLQQNRLPSPASSSSPASASSSTSARKIPQPQLRRVTSSLTSSTPPSSFPRSSTPVSPASIASSLPQTFRARTLSSYSNTSSTSAKSTTSLTTPSKVPQPQSRSATSSKRSSPMTAMSMTFPTPPPLNGKPIGRMSAPGGM